MIPKKLLMPFTDKGKQVCLKFSGSETEIEIRNRKNSRGPTGNGFATGVSGLEYCGEQKGLTLDH